MKLEKRYHSLAVVSSNKRISGASNLIMPQELLKYNQKMTSDFLIINNLHPVFNKFPEDENIYIIGHNVNEDFPGHTHDYFEMIYVCNGELKNIIDGNELYMTEGDLILLNTDAVHQIETISPETLILNFCLKKTVFDRTLNSFYEDNNPISGFFRMENKNKGNYMSFTSAHSTYIQTIIGDIIQEYVEGDFHQSYALEALFILLFTHLVRMGEYSYYGMNKRMLEILKYIRANCIFKNLREMSAELGYNANYLTTFIKKHTGRSCKDIIQEAKLNKALEQLRDTSLSVYDIAENCGYSSSSHFFRIFRENFGFTPGEYRRRLRNEKER